MTDEYPLLQCAFMVNKANPFIFNTNRVGIRHLNANHIDGWQNVLFTMRESMSRTFKVDVTTNVHIKMHLVKDYLLNHCCIRGSTEENEWEKINSRRVSTTVTSISRQLDLNYYVPMCIPMK